MELVLHILGSSLRDMLGRDMLARPTTASSAAVRRASPDRWADGVHCPDGIR
jgi:hypothetical protein